MEPSSFPLQLIQLGGTGATLLVFYMLMRPTLKTMQDQAEKKDLMLKELVDGFNKTVGNHMEHERMAFEKLTSAIEKLILKKPKRKR